MYCVFTGISFLAVMTDVSIIAAIKYLRETNVGKGNKGESR